MASHRMKCFKQKAKDKYHSRKSTKILQVILFSPTSRKKCNIISMVCLEGRIDVPYVRCQASKVTASVQGLDGGHGWTQKR